MLCDTWNWSDDNDTVSGIAILDTTAIPEMRSAISMSFRIRQSKGPFIATQLNSTRRRIELRRRSVYSDADATQLNSTQLDWPASRWLAVALPIVGDSWVASVKLSIATQLNSTSSWVELCRYKRAFSSAALMPKKWNRIVLVDCCSRTHCCSVIIVIFCDFTICFSITGLQRARC